MGIIYWGLFLKNDMTGSLTRDVKHQHVTFAFKPHCIPSHLFGTQCNVTVIGYANDGENEGYLVEIPNALKTFYENDAPPHITISISETGKPVNTGKLHFKPCARRTIQCVIGGFTSDHTYVYEP